MSRLVNDPIHGHIEVEKELFEYIDTPQFQRLRHLAQLGTAYLVFPGASHRRFEHSLGTAHLAGEVVSHFQQRQPELEVTNHERFLVKLAGLCHDLGHGPYSHVFDNTFVPLVLGRNHQYSHEDMSLAMLDYLVDDNGIDISTSDVKFVKALIHPKRVSPSSTNEKAFLFDIVSNSRNSVDVDKFDYIDRDCRHVGMLSSFDSRRLVMLSRVIDNQVCFNAKESNNLYELFHMRYRLHKEVYQHKTAKAAELMICDIMREADRVYDFRSIVQSCDPARFLRLTDGIVQEIQFNRDTDLARAHELIDRLHRRNYYKFVGETLLQHDVTKDPVSAEDVFNCCDAHNTSLTVDDVLIDHVKINYGMKGSDPVQRTRFFSGSNPNKSFAVSREKVSHMLPHIFEERIIRVFVKKPEYQDIVHAGFMKFIRQRRYFSPAIRRTEAELSSHAQYHLEESARPSSGTTETLPLSQTSASDSMFDSDDALDNTSSVTSDTPRRPPAVAVAVADGVTVAPATASSSHQTKSGGTGTVVKAKINNGPRRRRSSTASPLLLEILKQTQAEAVKAARTQNRNTHKAASAA